jgi:triacylglycerol lipase
MYFPKGFNAELSIELGELVNQAYAQFEAFENQRPWNPGGEYSLVQELYYLWTPTRAEERGLPSFGLTPDSIRVTRGSKPLRIPTGFVAERNKSFYLIFRGTQTIEEWVGDLNIRLRPYPVQGYGQVHEGFLRTYNSIRKEIMQSLSVKGHTNRLLVAGHSLGAAMATLALPDIEASLNIKVTSVFTFGSPRVGDDAFARAYNTAFGRRSFRIVNTSDIVTSVPPPTPIAGKIGGYFSHVDTPIDMNVQTNESGQNHHMNTYLTTLKECVRNRSLLERMLVRGA